MPRHPYISTRYPVLPPRGVGDNNATRVGPFWEWLSAYYASKEWAEVRKKVLASTKRGLCIECGEEPATDVHHVTYCRVGHERWGDVIPLCHACHQDRHVHNLDARR